MDGSDRNGLDGFALDSYALWDAAYVLGSLSTAERSEYEGHLAGCSACQRQVAELSGVPGLLALTHESEVTDAGSSLGSDVGSVVSAPVPLYAGLAASVARRRRRFVLVGAAAAIFLTGATASITSAVDRGIAPPAAAVSSAAPGVPLTFKGDAGSSSGSGGTSAGYPSAGLVATGSLASYPWGTQISWECSYAAGAQYSGQGASQKYVLVMVSTSGVDTTLASWTAGPGDVVKPAATTSAPAQTTARLDIRDSNGATLLSAAP
ncbi:MAG: hypothetical protein HIU81_13550 [Acidobacteria bacterium]|nr:hypothetical protein [Acidobacteriota bacterium]